MSTRDGKAIRTAVEKALEIAGSLGVECEAYGEEAESFQVEVFRGSPESVDRSSESGMGVRVVRDGRVGFAWTCDLSGGGLSSVLEEAVSNARGGDECDADVLAPGGPDVPDAETEDSYPADISSAVKIEGTIEMEESALAADPRVRSSENASYSEVTTTVCVGSTRGFLRTGSDGYAACMTGAAAGSGGETRTGWYYSQARHPSDLDFSGTGREAGLRAARLLGGEPMPTGRYTAVFDPFAFIEIVSLLSEIVSAEMVVRGSSVLAGRMGEKVASGLFTLVDDPVLEGGCCRAAFDDEGVPASRKELISGGVLGGFLQSSYTARKTGAGAGGNAFRASFKSLPAPGPSNIFVAPGSGDTDALVRTAVSGILVQDVMGIHTADPVSGDFSVGINGLEIEGGDAGRPVCEMTVSGNILSLLSGIAAAGDGIRFVGRTGSPAVIVEGLSVSGR
jgi:PmbA protein